MESEKTKKFDDETLAYFALVGAKVSKLRARKVPKMRQEDLAGLVGCSQGVISSIESGAQSPFGQIQKIARALEIDVATLVNDMEYDEEELHLRSLAYGILRKGQNDPAYQALAFFLKGYSKE